LNFFSFVYPCIAALTFLFSHPSFIEYKRAREMGHRLWGNDGVDGDGYDQSTSRDRRRWLGSSGFTEERGAMASGGTGSGVAMNSSEMEALVRHQ
jgi:hypothetical protein